MFSRLVKEAVDLASDLMKNGDSKVLCCFLYAVGYINSIVILSYLLRIPAALRCSSYPSFENIVKSIPQDAGKQPWSFLYLLQSIEVETRRLTLSHPDLFSINNC